MAPELRVNLGGLEMPNPVAVASGTFGYGCEYADLVNIRELGAVIVKGIRWSAWPGNPPPRLIEVPGGLVNAIGLQGPGTEGFIREYLPFLRDAGVPVVVNVWGDSEAEYARVAERLAAEPGIHAIELNISCPNVAHGGATFSADPRTVESLVRAVRRVCRLPLMPKLAPNVPNIADYARAVEAGGADAISLINTLPAMVIDIQRRKPVLGNRFGGLSGVGIHPVAVKLVYETARAVKLPILAMGGILEPEGAIEFLLAGAWAVAVGTANFTDPGTALRVREGIRRYLVDAGMHSVAELRQALLD